MNPQNYSGFCISAVLLLGCAPPAETPPVAPLGQDTKSSDPSPGLSPTEESGGELSSEGAPPSADDARTGESPSPSSTGPLPFPEGTKVLHIGDSFAGALGRPLGELFEAGGMRSVLKHTDSSYLTDWAWDGNLQRYIWKYNPDLVMITLGANELEIVDPAQRERTIKKIISTVGQRPCVWVAIPLWEGPKNGLLEVIRAHAAPCIYMDTNALLDTTQMERISDGIHPTTQARKEWAAFVAEWLKAHRDPTEQQRWHLKP